MTKKKMWYGKLIETAKTFIKDERSGKSFLVPVLFLYYRNRSLKVFPLDSFIHNKDIASAFVRFVIRKEEPMEYLLLMETWVKTIDMKDGSDQALGKLVANGTLQVSELNSKIDCITVTLGTRDGKERTGIITYRKTDGKVIFDELKWMDGTTAEGRFVNLREHHTTGRE